MAFNLHRSYLKTLNFSSRLFFYFYFVFGIFFFFLGIAFFVPGRQDIVQIFFVFAHLFLYIAIAVFSMFLLRVLGKSEYAKLSFSLITAAGFIIFLISLSESADARDFFADFGWFDVISWSHGGSIWIRQLIGIGGASLGFIAGIFFLFFSKSHIKNEVLIKKSRFLGAGIFLLGIASVLAFILSAFALYGFWIVLSAELVTMAGLLFIYRALLL